MPVTNPFPLNITNKVNSAALLAWFQQFGQEGYLSAEEINKLVQAIEYIYETLGGGEGIPTTYTQLIAIGETSIEDNEITIAAGTSGQIGVNVYITEAPQTFTIPFTSSGKLRTDIIVLNTSGILVLVPGTEGDVAVQPNTPPNSVLVTKIEVADDGIGAFPEPTYLTIEERAAITYANNPNEDNPFATMNDLEGIGGRDIQFAQTAETQYVISSINKSSIVVFRGDFDNQILLGDSVLAVKDEAHFYNQTGASIPLYINPGAESIVWYKGTEYYQDEIITIPVDGYARLLYIEANKYILTIQIEPAPAAFTTLQQATQGTNKNLFNGINLQGTNAGLSNSGLHVNSFGNASSNYNTGSYINAMGLQSAESNAGSHVNTFGVNSSINNSGSNVNAIGNNSLSNNSGDKVNALGPNSGSNNSGFNVNALGENAGLGNTANHVNAFGENAGFIPADGSTNTFKNVNLFGYEAFADADNQTVFSKWISGVTKFLGRLSFTNITADRKWELPDEDGVIALQSYVDNKVAGLLDLRGNYDASGNVFPSTGGSGTAGAILKGDFWYISVAGTLGGESVHVGDSIYAKIDSPTSSDWEIMEANLSYIPEDVANKTDTMAGNTASSTKFLSAKGVYDYIVSLGYATASAVTSALALKSDKTTATTGAVISFVTPQVYNSIASPTASNITDNLTGAQIGIVQKIYHNHATAPTFPAGWVKRGTGEYVESELNIIYAEWSVGTTVEYWIVQ